MDSTTSPALTPLERRARRRVGMKIGFATHALVYILVNLGLAMINNVTGDYRWNVFPLMGWGLGLAIHGTVVFIALMGDGFRERMLEQEMDRLRRQG
jgi:hypothetical protein